MVCEVRRFGPDTGGQYVTAFAAASHAEAVAAIRAGERYRGQLIKSVSRPSDYPEFVLVEAVILQHDVNQTERHIFMVPK